MNKIIISLLSAIFMVSCATTQDHQLKKYSNLTVENVVNTCTSVENWRGGILGVNTWVLRFNNCLNVKFLLAVSIDINAVTEEIRNSSVDLILLHFTEYLNREKDTNVLSIKEVKTERDDTWVTFFYEITFQETRE
jgi:hypothetical protein